MKKAIVSAVAVCLVVAAAACYFLRAGDNARSVIPADATAVAMFDATACAEALDLTATELLSLVRQNETESIGIDFTRPCYAFVSKSGFVGVALNVDDEKSVRRTMERLGYSGGQQRGYSWLTNQNSIGCMGDGKLLLCGPVSVGQQDALRPEMVRLMTQSRQHSPLLSRLEQQEKGLLQLCASMEAVPQRFLHKGIDRNDAILSASVRVGKQDITCRCSVVRQDGSPLVFPFLEMMHPIAEPHHYTDDKLFWACANIKGDKLLPLLRQDNMLRMTLMLMNMCVDADMIIQAIDGDVTVTATAANDYLLTAKLADTDFLANVNDWGSSAMGIHFEKITQTDYIIKYGHQTVYFGIVGRQLYIASSPAMVAIAREPASETKPLQDARGKYLCGTVSIAHLVRANTTLASLLGLSPLARKAVEETECINIVADSPSCFELQLLTDRTIREIITSLTGK